MEGTNEHSAVFRPPMTLPTNTGTIDDFAPFLSQSGWPSLRQTAGAFVAQEAMLRSLLFLFEHLSGVYFFVKDSESRLVSANSATLRRLGVHLARDLRGRTDDEFFPPQIAASFVADDRQVLSSGQPLLNRIEIWYNESGLLDWFVTNKYPLCDAKGGVVGLVGTVQNAEGDYRSLLPDAQISRMMEYVRDNCGRRLTVERVARHVGLSARQLNRRAHQVLDMSMQAFLIKTRVHRACHALVTTDKPLADISFEHGFCDQSSFTKQFRKQFGVTPSVYRKNHWRVFSR